MFQTLNCGNTKPPPFGDSKTHRPWLAQSWRRCIHPSRHSDVDWLHNRQVLVPRRAQWCCDRSLLGNTVDGWRDVTWRWEIFSNSRCLSLSREMDWLMLRSLNLCIYNFVVISWIKEKSPRTPVTTIGNTTLLFSRTVGVPQLKSHGWMGISMVERIVGG